jgi:hypothetical protein
MCEEGFPCCRFSSAANRKGGKGFVVNALLRRKWRLGVQRRGTSNTTSKRLPVADIFTHRIAWPAVGRVFKATTIITSKACALSRSSKDPTVMSEDKSKVGKPTGTGREA